MLRIDAHHHLWKYQAREFDWLEGDLSGLRRDFLPPDLLREMGQAGVSGAVAVQARQSLKETDWLLEVAAVTPSILGVVGWLPILESDLADLLDRYSAFPLLKGIRHVVQAEAPEFMDSPAFNAGMSRLTSTGLVYDILIFERQLEEAIRLVDRHPNQSFVLDHIAKPRIADGQFLPWADNLRSLAQRPNVVCKVSGMVTEADVRQWTPEQLRPYFEVVLAAFTPARLMIGTDWPVLTAGCSYPQWWQIIDSWIEGLTADEQGKILGETARRVYHLDE